MVQLTKPSLQKRKQFKTPFVIYKSHIAVHL
jgi:hypothetical protein